MGIFRSLLAPSAFSRTTEPTADAWYDSSGWMNAGTFGASINLALHLSAVMACTRAIAQPTAMVPLITYEYLSNGGKVRAPAHPLYALLHDAANPEMTAQEFREYMLAHAFLRGAGYARIQPDDFTGYPVGKLAYRRSLNQRDACNGNIIVALAEPIRNTQHVFLHIKSIRACLHRVLRPYAT